MSDSIKIDSGDGLGEDSIIGAVDRAANLTKDTDYTELTVATANGSFRGQFVQRTNYLLVLKSYTQYYTVKDENKVYTYHYINLKSIIGVSFDRTEAQ